MNERKYKIMITAKELGVLRRHHFEVAFSDRLQSRNFPLPPFEERLVSRRRLCRLNELARATLTPAETDGSDGD